MDILTIIAQSFWFIAPAYATNAFPPLLKGKKPLDFGRTFRGKRVFGDGKTIEGTIGGIVFGVFFGCLQLYFQPSIPYQIEGVILNLPQLTLPLIVLLGVGAVFGDVFGAFLKRQSGIARGAPVPGLDQLGFLIFAVLFASAIYALHPFNFVFLIIITPLIHLFANVIGYLSGLKKHPW
jgi:CDP-2,3-bis-(O-geranylgeranyl)-sn-glycerol synthase